MKPGSRLASLLFPFPSSLLAKKCGVTMRTAQRWRFGRFGPSAYVAVIDGNRNLPQLEQLPALSKATKIPLEKLQKAWAADRKARS